MLELNEREKKEIVLALFYHLTCNHGTAGHNRLNLIAKLANHIGIRGEHLDRGLIFVPDGVVLVPDKPLDETSVKDGGRKHG